MKKEEYPKVNWVNEICIWNEECNCSECNLDKSLSCKPKWKYTMYFGIPALLGFGFAGFGLVFASINILIKILIVAGWIGYSLFFFAFWESRMLCNHCPYYANEEQRVLHCPTDRGKPKTGKYDPGPMNASEKIQFLIGTLILLGYPVPFLIISDQLIFLLLFIVGILIWILVIQLKVCPDCLNFSCPLNRVPLKVRNEFLKQNPIVKKAWEDAGYKIE